MAGNHVTPSSFFLEATLQNRADKLDELWEEDGEEGLIGLFMKEATKTGQSFQKSGMGAQGNTPDSTTLYMAWDGSGYLSTSSRVTGYDSQNIDLSPIPKSAMNVHDAFLILLMLTYEIQQQQTLDAAEDIQRSNDELKSRREEFRAQRDALENKLDIALNQPIPEGNRSFLDSIFDFFSNIGDFFGDLGGNLGDFFSSIGDFFSDLGGSIGDFFSGLFGGGSSSSGGMDSGGMSSQSDLSSALPAFFLSNREDLQQLLELARLSQEDPALALAYYEANQTNIIDQRIHAAFARYYEAEIEALSIVYEADTTFIEDNRDVIMFRYGVLLDQMNQVLKIAKDLIEQYHSTMREIINRIAA